MGERGWWYRLAPRYWGLSLQEYYQVADLWPLDPQGELFLMPIVVGQSMGGWTAVSVIQDQPERVSALVLANSTGGIRDPELDAHYEALKTWHPRQIWAGAYAPDFPQREPARAFLYQQITAWNVRRPANLAAQLKQAYASAPIVEHRIPTLFLTGEGDSLIPPPLVERVARQIPHAQLVQISATGHSPISRPRKPGIASCWIFYERTGKTACEWAARPLCHSSTDTVHLMG